MNTTTTTLRQKALEAALAEGPQMLRWRQTEIDKLIKANYRSYMSSNSSSERFRLEDIMKELRIMRSDTEIALLSKTGK